MSTLIDTIKGLLPDALIAEIAGRIGEAETAIRTALGSLIPTLLGGMIEKSEDNQGLSGLFQTLSNPRNASFLDNLGGLVGGGNLAHGDPKDIAGNLVGSLFGARTGDLLSGVRSMAGLKSEGSASALLGLAGPLVMSVLGKRIAAEGLSADGLKALFSREKESILGMMPVGLAGMLGLSVPASSASTRFNTLALTETGMAGKKPGAAPKIGIILPLLTAAAFAGLVYVIMQPRAARAPVVAAPETVAATPVNPTEITATVPETIPEPVVDQGTEIPPAPDATPAPAFTATVGGVALTGNVGGVEQGLINFIESGRAPCTDKECWFTMDRLTFATGSASLDVDRSSAQLDNIAAIMRAYPTIQLKVGGYTDDRGDLAANMRLSQARAESVVAALTMRGLPAERFNAEGFGPQHPVSSNDTEEGRAMNRRIDVRVRQR
jgi:outer membrane protein OmpA-like peptidoglycan-associated protein